jgi:hypothetical protein
LDETAVEKMAKNSLFVIGRNVYQAACGSANVAIEFVQGFVNETSGYPAEKRKAILDGMLFEIFFDREGKRRKRIKKQFFEEVFELEQYEELKPSFAFIADALTATGGDFYAVPGKGHELAVTVSTKKKKEGVIVDAIYIGGVDVLRIENDWAAEEVKHMSTDRAELSTRLREQLFLPARLLKVSFVPKVSDSEELLIPWHWTVQKRPATEEASV